MPFSRLCLVNLHDVLQHPEGHHRVGLGLVFDQDIDENLPAGRRARLPTQRGAENDIALEMTVIALHEGSRNHC